MATCTCDAVGIDPIAQWLANGAGTEKMRLTAGGSLGIGTTSPGGLLQVNGPAPSIYLNATDTGNQNIWLQSQGAATFAIEAQGSGGGGGSYMSNRVNGGSILLRTTTSGGVLNINMAITGAGNVGIGTTSPARLLHVNGFARYKVPAVLVLLGANQSIPSNTETVISWPSHSFDNDNLHSDTTNTSRLTASDAGIWAIGCNIIWAQGSGSGNRQVYIRKNGGSYIGKVLQLPTGISGMAVSTIFSLSANDYVEVTVIQTEPAALDVSSVTTNFWMYKISD